MLDPHPFGDFLPHWRAMAAVLRQTTGGTATLADAAGFPLAGARRDRCRCGTPGRAGRSRGATTGRRPDRARERFLGTPARARVGAVRGGRARGCATASASGPPSARWAARRTSADLFYLHQRMARWAAPTHAAVEPVRDSTSALWSWRLLRRHARAARERARAGAVPPRGALEILAPELVDLPFEGGRPWPVAAVRRRPPHRPRADARRQGRAASSAGRRGAGRSAPTAALRRPTEPWCGEMREA